MGKKLQRLLLSLDDETAALIRGLADFQVRQIQDEIRYLILRGLSVVLAELRKEIERNSAQLPATLRNALRPTQ